VTGRITAALLCLGLAFAAAAGADAPPGAVPVEIHLVPRTDIPARNVVAYEREGVLYLSVNQLSVLLDGTKRWRSDLGRMTLVAGDHEITVWVDSEMAAVDESRLLHLSGPAFFWDGEIFVPIDLILDDAGKPRSWLEIPVAYDKDERTLEAGARRGVVSRAEIVRDTAGWRLVIEADVPIRIDPVSTRETSFVVRIPGIVYDKNLYPLPTQHPWFQGLRLRQVPDALEIAFTPGPRVLGYDLEQPAPNRVEIFLGWDERDVREGRLRPFARTAQAPLPPLRIVAVDPGHGGRDKGARLDGDTEANLTWTLGQILIPRLESELGVQTVLVRQESEDPDPAQRAARANRANADVYLSLHVHPRPGGPTAFVARMEGGTAAAGPGLGALGFRPFGHGQAPYVSGSLALARLVVDTVAEKTGTSSLGFRQAPIPELEAAAMPAVSLELGDDGKWTRDRLEQAAEGIVEALNLFRLAEDTRP
jgi:N-acetylmuramoyl-L-alanine amidase